MTPWEHYDFSDEEFVDSLEREIEETDMIVKKVCWRENFFFLSIN